MRAWKGSLLELSKELLSTTTVDEICALARQRTHSLYAAVGNLDAALARAYDAAYILKPASVLQATVVKIRDRHLLRSTEFWHGSEPVILASRQLDDLSRSERIVN